MVILVGFPYKNLNAFRDTCFPRLGAKRAKEDEPTIKFFYLLFIFIIFQILINYTNLYITLYNTSNKNCWYSCSFGSHVRSHGTRDTGHGHVTSRPMGDSTGRLDPIRLSRFRDRISTPRSAILTSE